VASLEKATELLEDYRTVGNLARASYWAGQRDRARQLFARAVQLGERELAVNPRNDEVHVGLADFLARIGRGDEALQHLAIARLENPHFMFFAAMAHAQLGDLTRGREWLDRAVAAGLPPAEVTGWIDVDSLRR
jgi:tetratricopeptide (TPR) repeat protein